MTSADGLEMVDLIGNNTNIKDCNFAEGEREREREKEKYTLLLQYFLHRIRRAPPYLYPSSISYVLT